MLDRHSDYCASGAASPDKGGKLGSVHAGQGLRHERIRFLSSSSSDEVSGVGTPERVSLTHTGGGLRGAADMTRRRITLTVAYSTPSITP
jgi:hypothetical protein